MRKLSSLILFLVLSASLCAQKSPHGDNFAVSCSDCHKTDGWKVDLKTVSFNHEDTKFPLVGQHQVVNCKQCHASLEFAKSQTECNSCHTDIHQQTVGPDCARCHTPNSWVVTNVTQLHQQSRFPLTGPHVNADCYDCHTNIAPSAGTPSSPTASLLRFDPPGIECYDCHNANYASATNPNHVQSNYSKNCTDCHSMNAFSWIGGSINHNFFPLSEGHALNDCSKCHTSGTFSDLSPDCIACHQPDYTSTLNPNHTSLSFSTNCKDCHTLSPGWKPAGYREHDSKSFPIYSGKHNGEWNTCADCHTNSSNYSEFTCIGCHEHNQGDTDNDHDGVSGYAYNSVACFGCHPTGSKEGSFDHSKSSFPLTGAHTETTCASCHTNGYSGTSNICASCHTGNYTQTINPNHIASDIANDCATCHTTNPGWTPATFPTHNNYYIIEGAHTAIANDCVTCHQGNYVDSPKTCFGCHAENFNQTTNPNHTSSQFPATCEICHSQNAWIPSTFDHNTTYPLTGAHATIASNCNQCHSGGYSNTPNTCDGCHQTNYNQSTNPNHNTLGLSTNCASCHTTNPGWEPATFAVHNNYYVLAGAHISISNQCADCHNGNYNNTPNTCAGCHTNNYNQTTNPNHATAQFPVTCADCHTQSAWSPSTYNHDGQYFPIYSGKHNGQWNTCADCHANPSNFAVFTCTSSCHPQSSTDSNHQGVNNYAYNSTACFDCHPNGSSDGKKFENRNYRRN